MDNYEPFMNTDTFKVENTSHITNSEIANDISHQEMNGIVDRLLTKTEDHYDLSTSLIDFHRNKVPNVDHFRAANFNNEFEDLRDVEMCNYGENYNDEDSDDCVITGTSQEAPFKMPTQLEVPLNVSSYQNVTIHHPSESFNQNGNEVPQEYSQPFPTYIPENFGCWTLPSNVLPEPQPYYQLAPAMNFVNPTIENISYVNENHGANMGFMPSNVQISANETNMFDPSIKSFEENKIEAPYWDVPTCVDSTSLTKVNQPLKRTEASSNLPRRNELRNEQRRKQRHENRMRSVKVNENSENTLKRNEILTGLKWRTGPASYWYDMYNIPLDENILTHRIQPTATTADDEPSPSFFATESLRDEDCCFSTWQLVNWEADVIIDVESNKSLILESNHKFACQAGWIPSENLRTVASFQEAACSDHFGIWPASSTGTTVHAPDVTQWYSIFSLENAQITESDWVSKIIIDPRHQNAQDPYLLELDLNNESIHFDFTNPSQTKEILISQLNSVYLKSSDSSHQLSEQNNTDENTDSTALTPAAPCAHNKEAELKKMKILSKFVDVSETKEQPKEKHKEHMEREFVSLVLYNNSDVYVVVHDSLTNSPFFLDPNDNESMDKSENTCPLLRYGIQHSTAATQLDSLFFPLKLDNQFLRHFHRPRLVDLQRPSLPMFVTPQSIYNPIDMLKMESEQRQKICQLTGNGDLFFMRSIADLSACTDHIVLAEYSEEFPPLMMQTGMASRVINYFKERSKRSSVMPNLPYGELSLSPHIPFLGQLSSNQVLQALENNMFRAPIYPHKLKSTDFLVIIKSSTISIRRVHDIFVVGQQLPLVQVPAPNSKKATTFPKDFFQVQTIRLFLQSKEEPKRIRQEEVKAMFVSQTDTELKKHLRIFAEYKKIDTGWFWFLKPQFMLPSEDDLVELIAPEEWCAHNSMMWGLCRLEDAGYNSKSFAQPDPDPLNEEDDRESNLKIEDEVRAAPWHTTRTFLDAQKAKCFLELFGATEPTGCGEAFSYARVNGKNALFRETMKARSNKLSTLFRSHIQTIGKRLIHGTDADLRKLTFKKAYNLLKGCGILGRDIKKLRRWDLIDLVRQMSTQKANKGDEEAIVKFARSSKSSTVGNEEKYRTECQRIFNLQNQVLSNEDELTSDDEDSEEEEEEPAEAVARRLCSGPVEEERELQRIKRALERRPSTSTEPIRAPFLPGCDTRCPASADNAQAILGLRAPVPKALCIRRQIEDATGALMTHCQTIPWSSIVKIYFKMNQEHKKDYLMSFCGLNQTSKEEKKAQRRQQDKIRKLKLKNKQKVQHKFGQMAVKKHGSKQAPQTAQDGLELVCGACGKMGHMRSSKTCLMYPKSGRKRGRPPLVRAVPRPTCQPSCQPICPVKPSRESVLRAEQVAQQVEEQAPPPVSPLSLPLPNLNNITAYQLLDLLDPLDSPEDTPGLTYQPPPSSHQVSPPQCHILSTEPPPEPTEAPRPPINDTRQSSFDFLAEQLVPHPEPIAVTVAIPKLTLAKQARPTSGSVTQNQDWARKPSQQHDLDFLPGKQNSSFSKKNPLPKTLSRTPTIAAKHTDYLVDQNMRGNRRRIDPRVALNHQFEEIYKGLIQVAGYRTFLYPVRKKDYPTYYTIIEHPMDLSTVKMKINKDVYETRERFIQDIKLMYDNCIEFNGEDSEYTTVAKHFLSHVMEQFCVKERKLMRLERLVNPLMDDDDMVGMRYILDGTVTAMEEVENSRLFQSPVDKKKCPDYAGRITRPMDLSSLRKNIKSDKYRSREDFLTDANLIVSNSVQYHGDDHEVTQVSRTLLAAAQHFFHDKEAAICTLEANLRALIDNASDSQVNDHLSNMGEDLTEVRSVDMDPPSNRAQRISESGEEEKPAAVPKPVLIDAHRQRIMADLELTDSEEEDNGHSEEGKPGSINGVCHHAKTDGQQLLEKRDSPSTYLKVETGNASHSQLKVPNNTENNFVDDGPLTKKRKIEGYVNEENTGRDGREVERIVIDLELSDSDKDEREHGHDDKPSEVVDNSPIVGDTPIESEHQLLKERDALNSSLKMENGNTRDSQVAEYLSSMKQESFDNDGPSLKERKKCALSKVVSAEREKERIVIDLELSDSDKDERENGHDDKPSEVVDNSPLVVDTQLLKERDALGSSLKMENGNTREYLSSMKQESFENDGPSLKEIKKCALSKVISAEREKERIVIDIELIDSEEDEREDGKSLENGHDTLDSCGDVCDNVSNSGRALELVDNSALFGDTHTESEHELLKERNLIFDYVNSNMKMKKESYDTSVEKRKMRAHFDRGQKCAPSKVVSAEREEERIVIDLELIDSEEDEQEDGLSLENGDSRGGICHNIWNDKSLEDADVSSLLRDLVSSVVEMNKKIESVHVPEYLSDTMEDGGDGSSIEDDGPSSKKRKIEAHVNEENTCPKMTGREVREGERIVIDLELSDSEDDRPEHEGNPENGHDNVRNRRPLELVDNTSPFEVTSHTEKDQDRSTCILRDFPTQKNCTEEKAGSNDIRRERIVIDLQLTDSEEDSIDENGVNHSDDRLYCNLKTNIHGKPLIDASSFGGKSNFNQNEAEADGSPGHVTFYISDDD